MNLRSLLILLSVCAVFPIQAQERGQEADSIADTRRVFSLFEWDMSAGYGFVNESVPEGEYGPFLFNARLEFLIGRKTRTPENPHHFLVFVEPAVHPVLLDGGIKEWEAGGNIGVMYLVRIRERNGLFVHGGSGPHYISYDSPEHQSGGFNFASNFGAGYQRQLRDDVSLTVGYRFRHVSNLDIRQPNLGLDNHFLTIGFKKDFERRIQERRVQKEKAATP